MEARTLGHLLHSGAEALHLRAEITRLHVCLGLVITVLWWAAHKKVTGMPLAWPHTPFRWR